MSRPVLIQGMKGLGDGIYQRPFVRAEAARRPVYLETPWPQLYEDMGNVFPVRVPTTLRTQAKNAAAQPEGVWHKPPVICYRKRFGYGTAELRRGSIVQALERAVPLAGQPFVFDVPAGVPVQVKGPYVVVRPVTVRKEWHNAARNPDPSAVFKAAMWAQDAGYRVVLVADLADGHEVAVGALPPHDEAYLAGELGLRELIGLVRGAAAVIGGVGWIVPMSIAAQTPLFVVQGGQLAHNGPKVITDPRMDISRVGWATPRYPCHCENMKHLCRKDPADLRGDYERWAKQVGLKA